jgi:hypothetical protein
MASKNTQKVNERLALAEEAARAGNFEAAANYAKAAAAYSKSASSTANVNNVIAAYSNAATAAQPAAPTSNGSGGGGGTSSGGSYSSSATSYVASPPQAAPVLPNYKPANITSKNFKVAPSDIIQFDDSSVEIALITDLLFEDIGATELANMSRSDLIDGQEVIYAPIKNLPTIRRSFNPNNIVATSYDTDYFSRFAIDLSLRGVYEPYFDDNGDLVIEIDTVEDSEEIQVQILTNGTIDLVESP